MSDFDDDFMEDDEQYDFEYEDDDEEEVDASLENLYYTAKSKKEDDQALAISEFEAVIAKEDPKSDWGFKSLKQLIKIHFHAKKYDKALAYYQQLMTYTKGAVTKNYSEKSLNKILDYVSAANETSALHSFYGMTLDALKEQNNERLWIKTNLKLAKLWLDTQEYSDLQKVCLDILFISDALYLGCQTVAYNVKGRRATVSG